MSQASLRFASKLAQEVHRVLWEEWDPLRVNGAHTDDREYADYVAEIVELLEAGADVSVLTKLLGQIREGWGDDPEADRQVAMHLVAYCQAWTGDGPGGR